MQLLTILQWDGCLTLLHLAWPWYALSQSRTCTHLFLGCARTRVQRKLWCCATSLHWCCHSCGSCSAIRYAAFCFTHCSYKDSQRVSWFPLQWWHRVWHWIYAVGTSAAALLRHLGAKFQGCQLLHFAGSLSSFLEVCPWNSGLPGCREKPENMESYSIFKCDSWLFAMKGTYDCLLSTSLCLFACSRTCRCSGRSACTLHPKSSFCVCKSQHPLAQVSLFPSGGCRGSAWWGYMCISSCPFEHTSLWVSHFSKVAQLFPCVPSTEHFLK